ncbi:tRNA (adenosine(37)-N6)-dimethylallyltransferase MiaA [Candidatus Babeliales bacterium]|nr:tRNA (adenosine(37)-N6)-dimethylallyltransferase MiaA [Candidatus Babeliales bacterium]MCF7899423.1 tRNA (adenosine(37)-N6)-dimethylallyltransferase MiaA [Candidatus Babeliales bacterium]
MLIKKKPFVLIITGPTACGKTALSDLIAKEIPSQIINADVGQFYTKLSVGTAKPDLKNQAIKHNLFDIMDKPKDLSAFEYSKLAIQKINEISMHEQLPILVGGSLFYIKSLFFNLQEAQTNNFVNNISLHEYGQTDLWYALYNIDPQRAQQIHKNDIYRINRALEIWQKTGILPSAQKPNFDLKFNALFVFIDLPKEILEQNINQRTIQMFKNYDWILEAENLMNRGWQDFVIKKNLIGYKEIFEWINQGKKKEDFLKLIQIIQLKTRQYAKKQIKFWKSFKKELEQNKNSKFIYSIISVNNSGKSAYLEIKKALAEFIDF